MNMSVPSPAEIQRIDDERNSNVARIDNLRLRFSGKWFKTAVTPSGYDGPFPMEFIDIKEEVNESILGSGWNVTIFEKNISEDPDVTDTVLWMTLTPSE